MAWLRHWSVVSENSSASTRGTKELRYRLLIGNVEETGRPGAALVKYFVCPLGLSTSVRQDTGLQPQPFAIGL